MRTLVRSATGASGGCVPTCASRATPPTSPMPRPTTTPAAGCTSVASSVTTGGATTKAASSATDSTEYAVCRRAGSEVVALQRERTAEPMSITETPATTASANQVQTGAPSSTAATRPREAATSSGSDRASARRWPQRSMTRDQSGPAAASERVSVPETAPPSA